MVTAIILAGGKGERMGTAGADKCFLSLGSKPVIAWSLLAFETCADVDHIILVTRKEQLNSARMLITLFGLSKLVKLVSGGSRRQDSVQAGLQAMDPDTRIVVVHDGARPCVRPELISRTISTVKKFGSGVAAAKLVDTIKVAEKGMLATKTLDRDTLWAVQTPQAFKSADLIKAYKKVESKKATVTDDAGAFEFINEPVHIVESIEPNIKITRAADLGIAAAILQLTLDMN